MCAHGKFMCGACGTVKAGTPPELRQGGCSSLRLHWPLNTVFVFPSELSCVPGGDKQGNHVRQGQFQSGESPYRGQHGGRSRKCSATKDNTSSKWNMCTLSAMWDPNSFDILLKSIFT